MLRNISITFLCDASLQLVGMMDGGRISGAISPWIGVVGLAGGVGLVYTDVITNPIMYLILAGGAYSSASRLLGWNEATKEFQYYNIGRKNQLKIFSAYVALVASLMSAIYMNNKKKKSPKELHGNAPRRDDIYYGDEFETFVEDKY